MDSPESVLGPTPHLPERSLVSQHIFGDGTDWSLTGGFLWRLSSSWRIAGVYRQGLEVDLAVERRSGEAIDLGVPPGGLLIGHHRSADQAAVGRRPRLCLPGCGWSTHRELPMGSHRVLENRGASRDRGRCRSTDADELHLGAEYVFSRLDADPSPFASVPGSIPITRSGDISDDPFNRALMPRGRDEMHYSLGLGVAMHPLSESISVSISPIDRTRLRSPLSTAS